MDEQVFADGIGAISIIGTTVRLDFVSISPTERDEKGQMKTVFTQRVVMGIDGFLRSTQKIQEALQALQKMGALQPAPGAPGTPADAKAAENTPMADRAVDNDEHKMIQEALGITPIPPRR
jgi:hypothetical protein